MSVRQADQLRRLYARSSLRPVTLVSAEETRLDGYGSGRSPARVSALDMFCRCVTGSAALMLNEKPDYLPFELLEPQAMSTAASLDTDTRPTPSSTVRGILPVTVDGVVHRATYATRGPLGVVLVDGVERVPYLALATSGLDVHDLHLTTAVDFDALIAAALGD